MIQLLHTPEGVRDLYNGEQAAKTVVLNRIRGLFSQYGYRAIQPPTYEYFDIFNAERGTIPSREMYKFFDRDGETLVLRPDFTPAIARCAAKYFMEEMHPIRLCYDGNTFINNSSLQGRLKESTQAGVELIGDNSPEADAEALALTVDCMLASGLEEFLVEVGQVDYFRGLVEEAGLDAETTRQLCERIENKNYFGVEELLQDCSIPEDIKHTFLELPNLFGEAESILAQAKALSRNETMAMAVERLEQIYALMKAYGKARYVTFDLGMLSSRMYYTGIIFQGYTYGTGDSVVAGGRYDNLIGQFGKDAPSVGFGINIDVLMAALMRQKIAVDTPSQDYLIVYDEPQAQAAIARAVALRAEGRCVSLVSRRGYSDEEFVQYAKSLGIREVIFAGEDRA